MKKQYFRGAIAAYNEIVAIINELQPIVNKMLKEAKRTSTGKLFQKDKDKITAICHQYKTDKISVSFWETNWVDSQKWELQVTNFYIAGEYSDGSASGKSTKVDFTWYSDADYERKFSVEPLPEVEQIEEMMKRHKDIMQQMKDLESERYRLERKFGIDSYSNFIGK